MPVGRRVLGTLLASTLLFGALVSTASAAECTDTYTGPAEGSWTTGSNWSAGVPGEADVACIGAGKTVNMTGAGLHEVKGLQGEGTLALTESTIKVLGTGQTWWIGSLKMGYLGNLTGAGTLEVRSSFAWETEATMSGAGKTILGSGSVSTIGAANAFFSLVNRTLVNEGTLTQREYSTLAPKEGGVFENLGTYTLAGNASLWQIAAEGAGSAFVNKGTFQKTGGVGTARLLTPFENLGTVRATSGAIGFEHSGTSFVSADGSTLEGPISFEEEASVTLGTMTAPSAELSLRESQLTIPAGKTAAIGSLQMSYQGNVTGAGTLEVGSSLAWEGEATMSGAGKTILGPSSVSTMGFANSPFSIAGRTLVNEGTLTQHGYSTLVPKEGGIFENLGTYNVNGEESRWQIQTEGAGSAFVNKGTFQKTAGTGRAKILADFENLGTIRTTSGTICFEESGSSLVSADGSNLEGPVAVENKASATLGTMTAPSAELSLKGSQLTVPYGKTASIGNLTMENEGTVTGVGTLEISKSLAWVGAGAMENIGSTVIASSATATVTSTSARLIRRTLVNEGTLTLEKQGQIVASEGATLENNATLKANSVPAYGQRPGITTGLGLIGPKVVNNGAIRKTAGAGETRLAVNLENKGTIDAETGTLLYDESTAIVTLKPGSVLEGTNRFEGSALAGEDFSVPSGTLSARESTILLEGENTKIANLKVDYGTLIGGAGHVEVTEALLWEGESTFSGTGRLTLGSASKNVLDGGGTTETLAGWFLVNEGTFTRKSGALNMNGGAVLENKGTVKLNAANGRGGKTTNEYDSEGRVVSQTDPAGRTITFKYEGFHTTITNKATGEVTDEWFTSYNEPFSVTHGYGTPQATTRTFSYNQAGQLAATTDGNGHTTTYGYDEAGNRTSQKDPLGHESKWAFNSAREVTSSTTPGGETTTIKRDANGNVESISRPAPGSETQTLSFEHGSHGELKSLTNPLGKTWSFAYDSYGDPVSETDPLGDKQTLTYDKDSRLTAIVSPRGNVEGAKPSEYETKVERDTQGRPLKVTDPLGHATEYTYDANGNLASLTDAKGHTTKFTYNADDERTKVEKPTGATLETGYDGAGFLTSQTDGNGKTTTYVRNVLEQPVEVIDPLGRKTAESFDAAGNLKGQTDPSGREATYSYDSAGRLTEVSYSEKGMPAAHFGYDADGNLTAMSDGSGESTFAYDQLGRLTRSQDGHGDVVSYGYDLANQQTSIVYPNGKSVSRSYDGAGRLESISDWLGGKTSFAYDAESNLLGIGFPAASGNVDEYSYDRAARMSEAKFKKGSETLASLTYTRDPLGQVEEEARHGLPGAEKVSYGFDQNNRLTKAGSASFEYDAADNLTAGMGSANAYDAAGQLEKGTGAAYSYDKEGERSSETKHLAEAPEFLRTFGGAGSGAGNLSAPVATATDKEGNVWVADTGHNRIQEFNSKGEFLRQVGAFGEANGQFKEPRGIAINQSTGNLYVADSKNNRIEELGGKGEFIRSWGSSGEGAGKFLEPTGVAIDPEGHVWTVETGTSSIGPLATPHVQEFSSEGAYLGQFGSEGSEPGHLAKPQGIAISAAGNVYVADTNNNRVQEFKPGGELIRVIGKQGTGNGEFKKPVGLGFDPEGKLWVADAENNRLQRFSSEGAYLSQFGSAGNNNGQLSEPKGLAVDGSGNVWVADTANNRVQEFSAAEFLRKFGGAGSEGGNLSGPAATATDKEGNVWVADTGHNRIQEFNSKGEFLRQVGAFGEAKGQFKEPRGIAINQSTGNLYVADSKNNRIQEFNGKGEFIRTWGSVGEGGAGNFAEPTGVALDSEGHVWTVETGTSIFGSLTPHIQKFSAEGTYLAQFGAKGSEAGKLEKPQGIAISAAGNVYVADTNNNRVQEFKPGGELIRVIGKQGSGNGEFKKPVGLGFDPEGKLWVADAENNRVQRLSAEGAYLSQFGTAGNNNGQLFGPKGLAVDSSGNVWVADTSNSRVQEFTATEFLRKFGGAGSEGGNLSAPAATATDKEGNVWVADTGHNRIQEFNPKGEFLRQFGAFGAENGQFNAPRGLAVDSSGNVYVADSRNNRIQEFNAKGEFIRKWGSAGEGGAGKFAEPTGVALDSEGHLWTVETGGTSGTPHVQEFSSEGAYLSQFGTKGSEPGQLSKPQGIAISSAGNLYLADTANNRIEEFKPSGELIRAFGKEGTGNGEFKKPAGLGFDGGGALWVADTADNRLQRFSSTGTYLAQLGSAGNDNGQLSEPKGLAVDGSGNLWVADTANNRVQEFAWASATTTYAYDQAGELTSVQRPAAGSLPAIDQTIAYDATGLIASKTAGSATRYLAWDASAALPLLLNDGENSYLYGPGGLPVEQINAKGEPTYLHHDQLGSTRLLTGSSGTASAAFTYTPYGALEAKTGTATTPLGFAGQYTDAESGLQYLRARFYDPSTGQFLSRDPLAAITREPFDYAANNPLVFTDPSGLDFAEELGGLGIPCLFCEASRGAQELLEPPFEEAGNAANWLLNQLGTEELDEGEYENPEPCLEPPINPWERGTEIGHGRQELLWAAGFADRLLQTAAGGPPGGSRGRALLAVILILVHAARHSG